MDCFKCMALFRNLRPRQLIVSQLISHSKMNRWQSTSWGWWLTLQLHIAVFQELRVYFKSDWMVQRPYPVAVSVGPVGVSNHLRRSGGARCEVNLHHVAAPSFRFRKIGQIFGADWFDQTLKRYPTFLNQILGPLTSWKNRLGRFLGPVSKRLPSSRP